MKIVKAFEIKRIILNFVKVTNLLFISFLIFAGGNQRELARAKNLKKNDAAKKNEDGLTPLQRRER